jgi:glycosyltransferase involved in cell wall biosynthesis
VSRSAHRPIRVLHLRDSTWVDGPGRTIVETAAHVDPKRIEFHIGVLVADEHTSHPMIDAATARGAKVHRIVDSPGISRDAVSRIVDLLNRLEIDVLHSSEFRSNVLSLLCRLHRPSAGVTTVHGWIANDLRGKIYRLADKLVLRSFDAVIVVSDATRRLVPRWWLPDSRVHVLRNALVLDSYGAGLGAHPRRRTDPDGRINLLNVGRLSPEKGQGLLLAALAPLMADRPGLRLRFAGNGPLEPELRRMAVQLGIVDRVDFLGYVKDMGEVYGQTDLVIQSSLTEGLPNVVLEAAYLRVPLVATDVGGTAEVIEHERSGWLVRPGLVADLRDGVRKFLEDPRHFAGMAETAHRNIKERFSFEHRTKKLMDIYEGVFAKA